MDIKLRNLLSDSQKHIVNNDYNEALKSLIEALNIDKKNPKIYLQMAKVFFANDNNEQKSIEFLNNALTLAPSDAEVHLDSAKLVYEMGNISEHNKLINRALQLDRGNYELNLYLANHVAQTGNLPKALEYANVAMAHDKNDIAPYETLAAIHEGMANTDETQELVDTVKRKFQKKKHLYIEARLLMKKKKFREATAFIKKYVENNKLSKINYGQIMIDLAYCLDKVGDYKMAYEAVIEGKKNKLEAQNKKHKGGNVRAIIANYTEYFSKADKFELGPNNFEKEVKEPIFIVGFPRSGTTLVEQIIYCANGLFTIDETPFINNICSKKAYNNQPQGAFLSPEEIIKLSKSDIDIKANRELYSRNIFDLFGDIVNGKRIIDKMPANTTMIPVIKAAFPNAKIISVIRDPRDTMVSCLFQNFLKEDFHNFDEATKLYQEVMNLYSHYRRVFKGDILEIRYEDILDDFENKAKKIYDFVDEKWTDDALKFHKKEREIANRTPNRYVINEPIYKTSVSKWKNYESELKPYLPRLEKYIKEYDYKT